MRFPIGGHGPLKVSKGKYVKRTISVSENDDSHCARTTKVEVTNHGKERLNRKAFRRPRKTDTEGADVTC